MNRKKIQKVLFKLKNSFLEETEENRRMLDIYANYIDGKASDQEIDEANYQLKQVLKSFYLSLIIWLVTSSVVSLCGDGKSILSTK